MADLEALRHEAVTTTLKAINAHATPDQVDGYIDLLGDPRHPEPGFADKSKLTNYITKIKEERQCKGQPLTGTDVRRIAGTPYGDNLGIPWMAKVLVHQVDPAAPPPRSGGHKSYCALKGGNSSGIVSTLESLSSKIGKLVP